MEIPRTIGRYELRELLGAGAMGQVYRAHDPQLRRDVALKIVKGSLSSAVDSQRFQREALTWAQVKHPAVVQVLDSGVTPLKSGAHASFLVLELIEGETLDARVARDGPLPEALAVQIAIALCGALDAAHEAGVLHRDLKPSNVLLDGDRPKLTDFGLAKLFQKKGQSLTASHDVVGTPAFMSPEQVQGQRVGPSADIYALGATLYFMLSGKPPHTVKVLAALFDEIVNHPPPALATLRPGISPRLNALVSRCLAKDPAGRFPTAKALSAALTNLDRGAPAGRSVTSPGALAGTTIAGILLGVAVTLGAVFSARDVDLARDPRYLRLEDRLLRDDWEGAEDDARALLRAFPAEPQLHVYLGDSILEQDDREPAAARAYEAALELEPDHPRALQGLIVARLNHEDYAQAKVACERALALYPDWAVLHRHLAAALNELEGLEPEFAELARAIELDPRDYNAYRQRSTSRLIAELEDGEKGDADERENYDKAEADIHEALEIIGHDKARLYDNLLEIARQRGDPERALHLSILAQGAAFRELGLETLLTRRVGILMDLQQTKADAMSLAASDLSFLLEAFPEEGEVHAQYSAFLARTGRLQDAIVEAEKALELLKPHQDKLAEVVRKNLEVFRDVLRERQAEGPPEPR